MLQDGGSLSPAALLPPSFDHWSSHCIPVPQCGSIIFPLIRFWLQELLPLLLLKHNLCRVGAPLGVASYISCFRNARLLIFAFLLISVCPLILPHMCSALGGLGSSLVSICYPNGIVLKDKKADSHYPRVFLSQDPGS